MDKNLEIVEKIEKLMTLAKQSSNINESEVALQKAQKLIHDYNINMDDYERSKNILDYEIISINNGRNGDDWKAILFHIIAKYNFGKVVKSKSNIYLFGRQHNREIIKTLYNNISTQIKKICNHDFELYKLSGGLTHGRTWKNSFLLGCISGFHSKLSAQKQVLENNSEHMALISLEKKLIDDKVAQTLKTHTNNKQMRGNISAYNQGVQTGKNLTQQELLK